MAAKLRTVLLRQSVKWEGVLRGPKAVLELPAKLAAELVASGAAMYPPKPEPVEPEGDGRGDDNGASADTPTANA